MDEMQDSRKLDSRKDSMPHENLADYLESLPSRFHFWYDLVPLAFPIWICDVVPSIIDAIQDVKSQRPKLYKHDDDVINVVEVGDQFTLQGNDRDDFMCVLAKIYRRLGQLKVGAAAREWNGLAWIKLYDAGTNLSREPNGVPKAVIWLWPEDVSGRSIPLPSANPDSQPAHSRA
ncbi:MAG: hypothetical protein Q9217_006066 [Psora testacea]